MVMIIIKHLQFSAFNKPYAVEQRNPTKSLG